MKFLIIIFFFLKFFVLWSQDTTTASTQQKKFYDLTDENPEAVSSIELDEVVIYPKLKLTNRKDIRQYLILKRKVKRVWPYAILASKRLDSLNKRLEQIESKRKRRKYTRLIQDYIENRFTDELKKLTKTEGQILVKLMHRQTGITTFDLVKDLKSGWRAFWYNTTASLFNISLKETYQPYKVKEDFYIESILVHGFVKGELEKQSPNSAIDFIDLFDHWEAAKENDNLPKHSKALENKK